MKIPSDATPLSKKLLAISIILLFSVTAVSPLATSKQSYQENISIASNVEQEQELDLLRVEHYLYVNASEDVGMFHIRFSFPPDYEYQVPLMLEFYNDSTVSKILQYHIENDTLVPNKIINFTIGSMKKDESVLLHFSCWVLVKNHDFSDLPPYVKIPKKYQLPEDTKIWLASTKEVQLHSLLIRHKARQLHGMSDNLIRYAKRIAPFIRNHRLVLFVLELNLGLLLSQDARTTLLINGENVGRSHLACAFFRLYNIPARVLLVNNDQGFWTQMHYMVEYYCPGYGWVLVETTRGETPYATKRQIVNRVCYPQDEEDTKNDYIFPFMTGEERWLWIDNDHISPYYVDCKTGSKAQMFSETNVSIDQLTANYAFVLTQIVFRQYQKYLGLNFTGENLLHFQNAIAYQKKAILALKQSQEPDGYLDFMNLAYTEYEEISI
ncbi:MAG: transglutaminase domain-containing protein [Thermoplasmata archaeon]|nr:transglutaminase domain-containing protein [Thermoplasmata archaeon]MBE3140978.1 transglutaminase domain-containing protein [Thermoplasmata archaeon]